MSRYFDLLKMLEDEKNGIALTPAQATAPTTPEEAIIAATAQQTVQPTQTIVNDIIETNLAPSSVTPINSNIINDLTIYNDFRNTGAYAQSIGGIDTLRHPDANGMHFGNPFSPNNKSAASVYVPTIKDSVIAFGNWLKGDPQYANVEPERRQWIINQINNGSLKGKPLVYYTNNIPDNSYGVRQYDAKIAPNHAHVLLDYINNGIPALDKGTQQFYEVSSAGDKRFSALYATFKPGTNIFGQDVSNRTIESVYQHGVKQGDWITNDNYKTGRPLSKAIITGNTEDDSYNQGYLPLWKEWAKQNPELIEDLRNKSKGMQLSDKYAKTKVSQARALTDILAMPIDKGTQQMSNIGKVIYSDDIYTRDLVSSNPNTLYLFGDNTNDRTVTHYIPSQTQAVIRGLPNAIGLDTKHNRGLQPNSYFTDADYDTIMKHYDQQFADIENKIKQGYNVVIPSAGIGTGKAQLQARAPRIYMNLSNRLNDLAMRYPDKGAQQMQELDLSLPNYIESAFNPNKALAGTIAKDTYDNNGNIIAHKNDIVLRKFPSKDPIGYFFNYISGTDNSPSSMQKKAVLDKLIADKHINSIDDLKSLITNEDDLKRFLLWHEKSHVDNNDADIYFANGRDRMTPDKLDIETRATVDAINKLRAYKGLGSVPTEQLLKVISGGQTGADIMGVSIAKKYGLPTGGTIGVLPNGQFITEVNNYGQNNIQWDDKIDRNQFGFTTTTNQNYPYRTKQNVLNSDGTIYFTDGLDSKGYIRTSKEAQAAGKPFLVNPKTADEAYNFIKANNIKTLNIAGNRGSQMSPEFKLSTEQLLELLFSKYKK